jgi:hypothetical protein
VAHGALDRDDVASGGDESAGEVVPQVVQLVRQGGVLPGRAPAVVDEVVVPGLAAFVEQPSGWLPGGGVLSDVLGEDGDQLVRQVDGALGLVLRPTDHDRDPAGGLDEILARLDVRGLGSLELAGDPQRAGEEVNIADLDAERLAAAKAREGAQGDVRREPSP